MIAEIAHPHGARPRSRRSDQGPRQPARPSAAGDTEISHISATLISEIGYITELSTSAKLVRYTGGAPIPVYSSDEERYRLYCGYRRPNSVLPSCGPGAFGGCVASEKHQRTSAAILSESNRRVPTQPCRSRARRTELNHRPRAILDDHCPIEIDNQLLTSTTVPMLQ